MLGALLICTVFGTSQAYVTIGAGAVAPLQSTTLTLTASTTTPTVNQSVTFTATLSSGGTALSGKSVTIYHYLNNVRYNDTTGTTNANGQITLTTSFGSAGTRTYYATFAGDSSYQASTSSVVTVNVNAIAKLQTSVTLTASNATPTVNQSVTFTATLSSGGTALSGKSVTIYHYLNNVRYNDTTGTTNANGQITLTTSFGSAGTRTYYATFAGDSSYQASTSSVVTVNVNAIAKLQTSVTLTTSNINPAVNQGFTLSGYFKVNATSAPLSGKQITLLRDAGGTWTNLGTATTTTNGSYSFTHSEASTGSFIYQVNSQADPLYNTSYASCSVLVGTYQSTTLSMFITNSTTGQPDTSGAEPVGQPFALYGVLTDTNGAPLAGKQITLYSQNPAGQQTALATTTTATNGSYSFTRTESSQGAYFYWGVFSGDQSYTGCQNCNGWTAVTIGNVQNVTNSLYTTNANPAVNQTFTLYGYLRDASGIGIPAQQITLLCRMPTTPGGEWPQIGSYVTNATGFYTFTVSEPSAGQYWYETHFGGDANYAAAYAGQTENIGTVTQTSLSLNTSNTNPAPTQNFTLSGYLTATNGNPVSGAQIDLWRQASGEPMVWQASRLTGTNGYYSFVWSEAQPGEFSYMVASEAYQDFAISTASLNMTVGTLRPTVLSATTSNANPAVNQSFILSGYLKDNTTGTPLSGKQITLLRKDPTGAWTSLGTTATTTNGSYSFTRSEASTGLYTYQVNSQADTIYATSYASCKVLIGTVKPTTITASTSNANPTVTQSFTVSGTLTASGTAVPNEQVVLFSENSANQWTTIGTATTTANGSYSFTISIPTQGSYLLQATFYGDTGYGTSAAAVTETVS